MLCRLPRVRCETSGTPFAHTAEPDHDAPHVGLEHVTRGNARLPPDDSAPGAAACQAILTAVRALGIGFRAVAVIGQRVPVLHPLPDVPQHVIQSKCVRLFLAHGVGLTAGVVARPGNFSHRSVPAGSVSGARGVFPFRLGRKAVTVAVPLRFIASQNFCASSPAHALDREIRPLGIAGIDSRYGFILGLRHLVSAQLKRPGDRYPMRGLFIGVAFSIPCRTAHHEVSCRNVHEVHGA